MTTPDPIVWIEPGAASDHALYLGVQKSLERRIRKVLPGEQADDVLQTAFARLLQKLQAGLDGDFGDRHNRERYLFGIAFTVHKEFLKKQLRSRGDQPVDNRRIQSTPPVDLARADCIHLLKKCLVDLPLSPSDRKLLNLLMEEEIDLAATAEQWGISYGALRTRLTRVKGRVRALLEAHSSWSDVRKCFNLESSDE